MSKIHTMMATLMLALLFTACSAGDDYDSDMPPTQDLTQTNASLFTGTSWTLSLSDDLVSYPTPLNDDGTTPGQGSIVSLVDIPSRLLSGTPTSILFHSSSNTIQLSPMPNGLFSYMVGIDDSSIEAPPYMLLTATEIGYSADKNTVAYALSVPTYTFKAADATQVHTVKVSFSPQSVMAIDNYTGVLTLVLNIDKVFCDNTLRLSSVGQLALKGELAKR